MMTASVYIKELKEHSPKIYEKCSEAVKNKKEFYEFVMANEEAFEACPSDSIDYAVMEKTDKACVIPLDAGWSDIGSWQSLWQTLEKDHNGNILKGDVSALNSSNVYIQSTSRLVCVNGLNDFVMVETPDGVYGAPMAKSQDVKNTVENLITQGRTEATEHSFSARPWGTFKNIEESDNFKVKRITVKPGARLSLQKHYKRSEHWIVVKGEGYVTCGDKEYILKVNESTYIPVGEVHRLENKGEAPLEIIEVQVGEYLGEDDIVRLDDDFKR